MAEGIPVPADPLTAGITGLASGFASGLMGGSSTATQKSDSMFDASGFVVQFGDGTISTDRKQNGAMGDYMPYLLLAAGLLVVWRFTRKKASK
jgi:hypothetical protein